MAYEEEDTCMRRPNLERINKDPYPRLGYMRRRIRGYMHEHMRRRIHAYICMLISVYEAHKQGPLSSPWIYLRYI